LPPDRAKLKNPCYRKSCPIRFEEFAPLLSWWNSREQTDCAWEVPVKEIIEGGFNLDLHHPSQTGGAIVRTRDEVADGIKAASNEMRKAADNLMQSLSESKSILPATVGAKLVSIESLNVKI